MMSFQNHSQKRACYVPLKSILPILKRIIFPLRKVSTKTNLATLIHPWASTCLIYLWHEVWKKNLHRQNLDHLALRLGILPVQWVLPQLSRVIRAMLRCSQTKVGNIWWRPPMVMLAQGIRHSLKQQRYLAIAAGRDPNAEASQRWEWALKKLQRRDRGCTRLRKAALRKDEHVWWDSFKNWHHSTSAIYINLDEQLGWKEFWKYSKYGNTWIQHWLLSSAIGWYEGIINWHS